MNDKEPNNKNVIFNKTNKQDGNMVIQFFFVIISVAF